MSKIFPAACVVGAFLAVPILNVSGADSASSPNKSGKSLPLSEVVLYSSGVGFFQHEGTVDGSGKVDLNFKVDDINDILKSMVVQDFDGGRVTTVTYESRDPISKTLKSFGVDLTQNPGLGQFLNQVRGETVQVMRPGPVTGKILGVEKKRRETKDGEVIETEFLNLVTGEGLQSIALDQIQQVKLTDERLNGELRQALEALASSHDTQKKSVGISFDGEGKRKVGISYISQTPVWKTSYRLVLDEKEQPYLQGWAIVENTTDEDWKDVNLTLVSGRPISFVMDLYEPLYSTRPVVQMDLYTSLRPQVYSDSMAILAEQEQLGVAVAGAASPQAPALLKAERDSMSRNRESLERRYGLVPSRSQTTTASGFGGGGNGPGANSLNYQYGRNLADSNLIAAQGSQMGELFRYQIQSPVSLARQKSAMLPIVSDKVGGEKISIYNQSVDARRPLNGFRLTNSTALFLMQGPITVFDDGAYAGDARIEDLAPGQDRLISYAVDLKTEVEPQNQNNKNEMTNVRVRKGTMVITRKLSEERVYNVRNRDKENRTVLIEHPFRSDWKLVEPSKAPERARDVYRFRVETEPGKTAKLTVSEEKQLNEEVQLISADANFIGYYVKSDRVSGRVKSALEKVAAMRDELNKTTAERTRREQRVNEITQEQGRLRENMERLSQNSDLYNRYVKKLDEQENEFENLRREIGGLQKTEQKQRDEINDYLMNLTVE